MFLSSIFEDNAFGQKIESVMTVPFKQAVIFSSLFIATHFVNKVSTVKPQNSVLGQRNYLKIDMFELMLRRLLIILLRKTLFDHCLMI